MNDYINVRPKADEKSTYKM